MGIQKWKPPSPGKIKINCDGACDVKSGKVAVGITAKKYGGWRGIYCSYKGS